MEDTDLVELLFGSHNDENTIQEPQTRKERGTYNKIPN